MLTKLFDLIKSWFESPYKREAQPPVKPNEEKEDVTHSDPTLLKQRPDWFRQTLADLHRHEGFREYAYPDPLSELGKRYPAARYKWGFKPAGMILLELGEFPYKGNPWTVGYGFTNGVTHNTRMDIVTATRRLEKEVDSHVEILDVLVKGWRDMPTYVKTVLANLAFNLGSRLKHFRPTLDVFERGDYSYAGDRLTRTLWYKQVGSRARELVERLKTGKIQDQYNVI